MGPGTYGHVGAHRGALEEVLFEKGVHIGFPHLRAEEVIDDCFDLREGVGSAGAGGLASYLVEGHEGVHHVFVSAVNGVLVCLNIEPVEGLMLAEPPVAGKTEVRRVRGGLTRRSRAARWGSGRPLARGAPLHRASGSRQALALLLRVSLLCFV